ncbi:MAG TPA: DNA primase [Candidatus Binataceae bacterium]|nr:DNA primase [Candidatus Binataceae bacterium]
MAHFGDDKIEEVRSRADIVEIIGAHVRLKRTGRNFTGLCPFHNEKTPSFSVNAERGFFHCFGCGVGGSVFDFIMRVEGLSFAEALRSLAQKYGVVLPERSEGGPPPGEREAMRQANEVAADFFAHVLWNTDDGAVAREYLRARGITDETARAFRLGYAPARPASLAKALERRGLREAGFRLGLIKKASAGPIDMFHSRVMFPIRDTQGRAIAFGGRVLDSGLPKYLNSPESPLYSKSRTLYGLFEARKAITEKDRAILVEGYFDVIALAQVGIKEVVAGCGTALTADQILTAGRFTENMTDSSGAGPIASTEELRAAGRFTKNIIACFDGDAAGRKASMRALEVFLQAGLLGRGIFIPKGFDPDTLVRERGPEAFTALIDNAELLVDLYLREEAAKAPGPAAPLAVRIKATQSVLEKLRLIRDPLQFDQLVRKAAHMFGVSEDILRREARRESPRTRASRPEKALAAPAIDAGAKAEIGLVALAVLHPELRGEITASGAMKNFEDRQFAGALEELCRSDEDYAALAQWISERLTPEQQSRVAAVAVDPAADDAARTAALMRDYIAALARRRKTREIASLRLNAAGTGTGANSQDEAAAAAQAVIAHRREVRDG